jgi:hypothetical protein
MNLKEKHGIQLSNDWKKVNKWAHFEKFFSVKENL